MAATASAKEAVPEGENEETFTEEIKDYAKTTMNELLGIFGYEDEITQEAVEDLTIKVPSVGNLTSNKSQDQVPIKAGANENSTVAMEVTPGSLPVIVKVEGNVGGNKLLLSQDDNENEMDATNVEARSLITGDGNGEGNASNSSLMNYPEQPMGDCYTPAEHQQWNEVKSSSCTSGIVVTYKDATSVQISKPVGSCSWCKKVAPLLDFTSSDGEKDVSCTGMCSALCFEHAVKNIHQSKKHIQHVQDNLRGVPISRTGHKTTEELQSLDQPSSSAMTSDPGSGAGSSVIPATPCSVNFWDKYLKETNSEAAPWSCFKQAATPPYNGFKPGMKLEVGDPRIVNTTCLVTVVAAVGSRIRCRFDGTDSANDVWHMVDSKEIHPLGWCEGNGGVLQPPVGFKFDAGKYPTFLAKALANVNAAPVRLFKREPPSPQGNRFKKGQKLEALDPKNAALICVASVAEIAGDKIRVEFDGYLGSDYWCRYDSMELFPAGWCMYSGHPLQPPGTSKKALKALQNCNTKGNAEKPDRPEKLDRPEKPEKQEKPEKKKPQPSSSHQPTSTESESASPSSSPSSSPCPAPETPTSEKDSPAPTSTTVQVYINHSCKVGPYLDPEKVAKLPICYRGAVGNVTKDSIQAVVNAAFDVKTVIGFLKTGHGKTKIIAKSGRQTYSCVLQHIDRVAIFWRVLERFSDSLKCCENLFCGEKLEGKCQKCGQKCGQKQPNKTSEPKSRRSSNSSSAATASATGRTSSKRQHGSASGGQPRKKVSKITIDDDDISSPHVCSTSPPKTWTVDEVVKYIEGSELAYISDLIKKHEIDGKALLLLTREMIMSYMGLKLGPAIKLLDIIEELKARKTPS